jgi:NADPH-dependent 2,4-dienoyl-CoA reductase/sulfur reductase-like enzyme
MVSEHFVIIGNGPAANQAALTLRENSPNILITLVGQEPFPYYKPHLLPDYISGKLPEHSLYFALPEFYKRSTTKLRLGQRVANIDFEKKELALAHKEIITFTGLIIACGGRQRIPEHMLVFQDLSLTLKTPADAEMWIEKLRTVDSVLIVGGDLTSLSLTKALLSLNKLVFFMLNEDSFWPVPLGAEVAQQVKRRLRARGVEILDGSRIKRVARISDVRIEVETDSEMLQVGILGAFFGMIPNVKFLARSGLDIDRGILVNEHLKTRFDAVYAAGDCAQVYHPGIKDYWVSIGYENAINLGKVAALNLLGGRYSVDASPSSIFCTEGIMVNTSWWLEF